MGASTYKMRPKTIYYNPADGDPATWANGLRLERAGAVRDVSWAGEDGQLEARVKDAGLTYRVRISHGALRPTLACACPPNSIWSRCCS